MATTQSKVLQPKEYVGTNSCVKYKVFAKFYKEHPRVYGYYKTELIAENVINDLRESNVHLEWAQIIKEVTIVERSILQTLRFDKDKTFKDVPLCVKMLLLMISKKERIRHNEKKRK